MTHCRVAPERHGPDSRHPWYELWQCLKRQWYWRAQTRKRVKSYWSRGSAKRMNRHSRYYCPQLAFNLYQSVASYGDMYCCRNIKPFLKISRWPYESGSYKRSTACATQRFLVVFQRSIHWTSRKGICRGRIYCKTDNVST